jgi:hypothetical protein
VSRETQMRLFGETHPREPDETAVERASRLNRERQRRWRRRHTQFYVPPMESPAGDFDEVVHNRRGRA